MTDFKDLGTEGHRDAKELIRELAYTLYSFGIIQEGKQDLLPLVRRAYAFLQNNIDLSKATWKTMETAPKDGTVIFAACAEWPNSQLFWNDEYGAWEDFVDNGRFRTPIAWIPIPDLSQEERRILENH